jgi:CubicO group peptidase (beta-lactamase class C family)
MKRLRCTLAASVVIAGMAATAGATPYTVQWGQSGDVPVPRDYDNDGRADYAVWRPADGYWHIKSSATLAVRSEQWGTYGDVPVPGDYDGDGLTDFAVWRPSSGYWFVKNNAGVWIRAEQWGQAGDVPVPGDYDGDGRLEFAVWRPSSGTWFTKSYTTGATRAQQFGGATDVPVPGNYDGKPGDDFAVWRPSTGQWFHIGGTSAQHGTPFTWGAPADVPITTKLCGDMVGRTVWRAGQWWSVGQPMTVLGVPVDRPVPANFAGDAANDQAVWQPATGNWTIEPSACDRWAPTNALLHFATRDVRGVTVAAVKWGQVVYANGAGYADANNPARPNTPWQLASISKLFVATAVLQTSLDLDGGSGLVNPFNPAFRPTLRELANHTAGVNGSCTVSSFNGADPSPSLFNVMTQCLFANPIAAWNNTAPGTAGAYSNLGAAWPARMVEAATGRDFAAFTRERIFQPLGMTQTKWFRSEYGGAPVAMGYVNGAPTNETGVSPYPIGNLHSTALDLARFMIMYLNDGHGNGQRVLPLGAAARAWELRNPAVTGFGLNWARSWTASGKELRSHGGVLAGVCTRLDVDPATMEGFVILTNGSCNVVGPHIDAIEDRVFKTLDLPY